MRILPALCAILLAAVVASACGSDSSIPGNSVARVGDANVKRDTFQHWMRVAAISTQGAQAGGAAAATVPDPPAYAKCIAGKRKAAPKPAKGQPAPTAAQFKQQCTQEYSALRGQVLQFLVNYEWFKGEASDQSIKVSDGDVDKEIAKTRKQSFPKAADFQKFLKQSGLTLEDIRFQVRLNQLQTKLRAKVNKDSKSISASEVSAYYKKNRKNFAQPERRDLRVVLTRQKGRADAALAALKRGGNWSAVAKQYSIDQASKAQGGVLKGVGKGQQEQGLDKAVFAARKGALTGPVKTQFGYYVFQVQKVTAPSQQTEKEATAAIKQLLSAQNGQKAETAFGKKFTKKWKGKTNCREGFKIPLCKGEKEPQAQTAPQGGAPPQQGGAQQAPPQGGAAPPQAPPPSGQGQQAPTPTPQP